MSQNQHSKFLSIPLNYEWITFLVQKMQKMLHTVVHVLELQNLDVVMYGINLVKSFRLHTVKSIINKRNFHSSPEHGW